ncbi:MAG TPA: hypothetical protein VFY60_05895 [Pyrinomonadaceae bacterium]|nr:hypothetical protein [Pyrinomonadaceae bacterium]
MMKSLKLLIPIAVFVATLGGGFALSRMQRNEMYDEREIANKSFRIRIAAYKERGVSLPGVYFSFQSATIQSEKWQDLLTVKGDEPVAIRPEQLGFVNNHIGYGFIGSHYIVTTNGGANWSIWDGENHLPRGAKRQEYNLSPYIESIELQTDGTGFMTLYPYYKDRARGPRLVTADYGLNWSLKE